MHVLLAPAATCFTSVREPAAARAPGDRLRLHPVAGADPGPVHDRPGRPAHPRRAGGRRQGARAAVRVRPGDRGSAGRPGGGGHRRDRDHLVVGAAAAGSAAAMRTGMRVRARWADSPAGHIRDIACFEPWPGPAAPNGPAAAPAAEPVTMVTTPVRLRYEHTTS